MDSSSVGRLVAELLTIAQAITGYPDPAQVPEVAFVPHDRLQEMACERPCEIRGWFAGGSTIYLDERLDPAMSKWDRSVLVHEIVHYLQDQDGAFGPVATCQRWLEREKEAYDVQYQWLRANLPAGPPPEYVRIPPVSIDCDH